MSNVLIIAAIIGYMALVVGIGFYFTSKNKSTDDFYLGGRKLGPFVTAMSAEASDMSSWLLMGLPGVALAGLVGMTGTFAEAVWTAVGLAVGTYVNWLIVAKRLRLYSEHIGANTIPDYLSNRFNDKSGALIGIAALIIIVFFVPYVASGFAGVGKLFNSLFGIDYHMVMVVGAVIIATYTLLGGFLAASTTDFIQSIIMTIALFVVCFYGISRAGGIDQVIANTQDVPGYFSLTGPDGSYSALPIASTLAWGLGYFGMPHILLRFMAIEDHEKLAMSRRIASVWVVISMGIAIFIGIVGYSFAKEEGIINDTFDPERIIVYIASYISKVNPLMAIVAGLIISGILASIMSTSDSQLLAASSSVSENIIHRFIVKDMSAVNQMILARVTVVIIAVLSCMFAWDPNSSVFRIVSFAWAGFGASFGPVVLFSLFWKKTNKWGALLGMLSGGIMIFVWKFGIANLGGIFTIYELLPAFVVNCIVILVVSIVTGGPDKETAETFDKVNEMVKENKAFN
ncbi:MAG: sodium/proline symporter [Eubacterium sp.]|nr:sodium/proline symporter [Eubacterium sp.]